MLMRTLARAILAVITSQERIERETAELYALNFSSRSGFSMTARGSKRLRTP